MCKWISSCFLPLDLTIRVLFSLFFLFFWQPLHRELYNLHPAAFFVPEFLRAINDSTEDSFRRIMSEPSPGVFIFEMLHPHFCELLLTEVTSIFLLFRTHIYVYVYCLAFRSFLYISTI